MEAEYHHFGMHKHFIKDMDLKFIIVNLKRNEYTFFFFVWPCGCSLQDFFVVVFVHCLIVVISRSCPALRKHAYSNVLKILPPKNENFQIIFFYIYHISAQNIDCGYSLEPPRRVNPSFYYIKGG